MKRPLVAVVSCYTFGLLLGVLLQPPLAALFAVSFFVLVLVLVLDKFRPFFLGVLLALAGWTNLVFHTATLAPDNLNTLLGNADAIVTVRGVLAETPHLKITVRDGQETERSVANVRVTGLLRGESWQPASGDIIVTTPNPLPD